MSDERLTQQLTSCCEQARAAGKRPCHSNCPDPPSVSCSSEASEVTTALGKARQIIIDRGGPSTFSYFGPNCEQTQQIPDLELGRVVSPCDTIDYQTVGKNYKPLGYDAWWPFGDHNWLELRCGDKTFTVDFWKGGVKDHWRSGKDAYGVCANY